MRQFPLRYSFACLLILISSIGVAQVPVKRGNKEKEIHKDKVDHVERPPRKVSRKSSTPARPKPNKIPNLNRVQEGKTGVRAFVDLGLQSGVKWATFNVGAENEVDYGKFFSWGECDEKSSYASSDCLSSDKTMEQLYRDGSIDERGNLTKSNDAAYSNWGGGWRIPTKEEWQELVQDCRWSWDIRHDKQGYKVTGPNGKSIFLPVGGRKEGLVLFKENDEGNYWSSTASGASKGAYYLNVTNSGRSMEWGNRHVGRAVRPVSD